MAKSKKSPVAKSGNDIVYTPDELAEFVCNYFPIKGVVLEPCLGGGSFYRALSKLTAVTNIEWCEIEKGVDFLAYEGNVDWIVTNPPWSKFREFIQKSCSGMTNDIVFLITLNHFSTKARLKLIYDSGYSIKELLFLPTPKEFPQSGFQLVAAHISKEESIMCKITKDYAKWKEPRTKKEE